MWVTALSIERRYALLYAILVIDFAFIYSCCDVECAETAIDFFYFSAVTVTTLGYGDMLPSSQAAKLWVSLETVCGLVLLGFALNSWSGKSQEEEARRRRALASRYLTGDFARHQEQLKQLIGRCPASTVVPNNSGSELGCPFDLDAAMSIIKMTASNIEAIGFYPQESLLSYANRILVDFQSRLSVGLQAWGLELDSQDCDAIRFLLEYLEVLPAGGLVDSESSYGGTHRYFIGSSLTRLGTYLVCFDAADRVVRGSDDSELTLDAVLGRYELRRYGRIVGPQLFRQ